jgi:two-component system, sensor histidine kinase and response regulator
MKKILVIEDDESLRRNLADILRFEGFEVVVAENGKIGYQMALDTQPDLILCDIMMPEMNGYEVLAALRKHPDTRLTPVIQLTAMAERENVRSGMELGADDYIIKPFGVKELLQSVNSRLAKSDAVKDFAESKLDELRSSLITQLPHELRTPLNGIIGFARMLKDNPDTLTTGEIGEFGNSIYKSGMRLFRLIQNYLIYAQLEIKNVNYPVKEVTDNILPLCKEKAEEIAALYNRQDDLELHLGNGCVHMSNKDFSKVIEELADNAFKFSETGQKVTITCSQHDNKYTVSIRDNGCGIKAKDIRDIGAYMQFDRVLLAQQGSGLGLIISRRIIESYQGEFDIQSTPSEGTVVTFSLPVATK